MCASICIQDKLLLNFQKPAYPPIHCARICIHMCILNFQTPAYPPIMVLESAYMICLSSICRSQLTLPSMVLESAYICLTSIFRSPLTLPSINFLKSAYPPIHGARICIHMCLLNYHKNILNKENRDKFLQQEICFIIYNKRMVLCQIVTQYVFFSMISKTFQIHYICNPLIIFMILILISNDLPKKYF